MKKYTDAGAIISPCKQYRYLLWREWEQETKGGTCLFVMLNPSTADGTQDDATIRRCVYFASKYGCQRLEVVNLFGYRATNPKDLPFSQHEATGPENYKHVEEAAKRAAVIVVAWGANDCRGADCSVFDMLKESARHLQIHCLGLTLSGAPKHPCRLPNATEFVVLASLKKPCENCLGSGWLDQGPTGESFPCECCRSRRRLCESPICKGVQCARPNNHRGQHESAAYIEAQRGANQ